MSAYPDPAFRASSLATSVYLRATVHCLTRPASLIAIGVLVVNDHVLKMLWPSWITGKLSDFAGLYFFPYLLLLSGLATVWLAQQAGRARGRRPQSLSRAAAEALAMSTFTGTAALFMAIKLSPITAEPAIAFVETLVGGPVGAATDPSDLLALVALIPAYVVWKGRVVNSAHSEGKRDRVPLQAILRKAGIAAVLVAATLAVVATSRAPDAPAVTSLAADRHYPNVLYATVGTFWAYERGPGSKRVSSEQTLYRSIDGGNSWTALADAGERIVPDPHRAGALYSSRLDGVRYLPDVSSGYRTIWPPPGRPPEKLGAEGRGMPVLAPTWQPDLIYVGVQGWVMRSYDAGATWAMGVLPDSRSDLVTILACSEGQPGRLFAAQGLDLYRSDDWGDRWTALQPFEDPPLAIAPHPVHRDSLLAATDRSILKSSDGGATWHKVWSSPTRAPGPLAMIAFDPRSEGMVYAAMGTAGLLVSVDDGESWAQRLSGNIPAVTVTRSRYPRLYVAAGFEGVYRQRGAMRWPWVSEWERMSSGLGVAASDFGDRLLNLVSWVVFLMATVALAAGFAPETIRRRLAGHVFQACLALWILVPALVLGSTSLAGAGIAQFNAGLWLACFTSIGVLALLVRAGLSWTVWCVVALWQGLTAGSIAWILLDLPILPLPVVGAGVSLVGLVIGGSALARRAGRIRLSKGLLIPSMIVVNAPVWLFASLAFWSPFGGR